jgi:hypothetical protein
VLVKLTQLPLRYYVFHFFKVVGGHPVFGWSLLCDDRAVYNDARFYTAKIHLGTNKIDSVAFKMWF